MISDRQIDDAINPIHVVIAYARCRRSFDSAELGFVGRNQNRAARGAAPEQRALRAFEHRSEEHTSELQSLMRISYAVFCLKKKNKIKDTNNKNRERRRDEIIDRLMSM